MSDMIKRTALPGCDGDYTYHTVAVQCAEARRDQVAVGYRSTPQADGLIASVATNHGALYSLTRETATALRDALNAALEINA